MNSIKIIFLASTMILAGILLSNLDLESDVKLLLDKSGPYIGADFAQNLGYTGKGIVIAVIDTGVDFSHPDLDNYLENGTIIGGYNFVSKGRPPNDTNGHGTQVAGIIAAQGGTFGIAPDAKILAYKVSDNGESVSSDLIVKAINKAVEDKVDIINISLGVNKTNSKIDSAVNEATKSGVFVVVAAGNDGPKRDTIGSPGRNPNAITVGATYNNITSSLVATFEINQIQYQVIPMLGVDSISQPIVAKIIDGKYGRAYDFDTINATGAIFLMERGSDKEGEIVYFAEKESNSADVGAAAVIVFNNEPGLYLGDVSESFTIENYKPRIPIVSLSQKEGLEIKEMLDDEPEGILNVFYNPDYVAFFSSRGPASPFYIKPDLVAPGAFVNSTDINRTYNFSSGTSFATPHVSGAAAILLEKYPNLQPSELKSILTTTAVPVTDAYGNDFTVADAGSGRLDLKNAFNAKIIIEPTFAIMTFSPVEKIHNHKINLNSIEGQTIKNIVVKVTAPENIKIEHRLDDGILDVWAEMLTVQNGQSEGKIIIKHDGTEYKIPMIFRYVKGSIDTSHTQGMMNFEIIEPKDWKYAKVSVINKETGEFFTTSITPKRDSTIKVTESGQYWIEASIDVNDTTYYAYDTTHVQGATSDGANTFTELKISQRPIYIAVAITAIIAVVGIILLIKNRTVRTLDPHL